MHYVIAGDINININDLLISTDYLYVNNLQALIIKCHITHHYGTILSFNAQPIDFNHNKQTKFENVIYKININYLNLTLKSENWSSILNSACPDNALNIFNTKMNEVIKKSSFLKIIKISNKYAKIKEWITKGLIISIRNKDKILRFCLFDIKLKLKLNRYKNILCAVIRMAKILFYQKSLKSIKKNLVQKKIWKMINEITGKVKSKDSNINKIKQGGGNLLEDEFSICNEFNSFFVNVGKNIENKI